MHFRVGQSGTIQSRLSSSLVGLSHPQPRKGMEPGTMAGAPSALGLQAILDERVSQNTMSLVIGNLYPSGSNERSLNKLNL